MLAHVARHGQRARLHTKDHQGVPHLTPSHCEPQPATASGRGCFTLHYAPSNASAGHQAWGVDSVLQPDAQDGGHCPAFGHVQVKARAGAPSPLRPHAPRAMCKRRHPPCANLSPTRSLQDRYANDPLNSPGPIMIKTGVEISHAQVRPHAPTRVSPAQPGFLAHAEDADPDIVRLPQRAGTMTHPLHAIASPSGRRLPPRRRVHHTPLGWLWYQGHRKLCSRRTRVPQSGVHSRRSQGVQVVRWSLSHARIRGRTGPGV